MQLLGKRRRNASLRLFEHPDFEQAILRAVEHFRERKLRPAITHQKWLRQTLLPRARLSGAGPNFHRG